MDKRLIVRQRLGCLYSKANESGKTVSVLINFYICSKFGDNYQLFDQFNWLLHNMCPVSRAIHLKICLSAVYDIYWKIHMVDLNQRFLWACIAHLVNYACLLVFKQVWDFFYLIFIVKQCQPTWILDPHKKLKWQSNDYLCTV